MKAKETYFPDVIKKKTIFSVKRRMDKKFEVLYREMGMKFTT